MSRSRPVAALAALAGLALGALAACGGSPAAAAQELRGTASFAPQPLDAGAARAVIVASERMGVEMLVSADPGENAVVSPASLTLAFAMLAPGASGPGASELTELLGTDPATAAVVAGGLLDHFSTWDGDVAEFDPATLPDEPFLHIANRAVVREGFEAEEDYLDALAENFDAGLALADFADAAGAKELLDEWVDHHTAGLIPDSAIEPTPDLVLVLQNAVLFGAQWESQFEQHLTYERDFTPVDGAAFRVPMMSNPHAAARYAEHEGWAAVQLPYTDGFVANFYLPPAGVDPMTGGPAAVEKVLEPLTEALSTAAVSELEVVIPTIDTEADTDIRAVLEDLGYRAIFDCAAGPFRGIAPGADLCIDQAAQQAVLKVDEEGTVAAAVTEIAVAEAAAMEPELSFVADRPFIMTIRSADPGWDLFQAVIRDPRA